MCESQLSVRAMHDCDVGKPFKTMDLLKTKESAPIADENPS